MASRVNTKLVVALVAGVIAVCVVGIGLYSFVLKRGPEDNVRAGDKAMADGEYGVAKNMYGRAVNRDPNNVEWLQKYRSAIEAWTPDTETVYKNEFQTAWQPMLRAMAIAQQTNIDASLEYLELVYRMTEMRGFDPAAVSNLERETVALVSNMQMANPDDTQVNRLRRFRALAYVNLIQNTQLLSTDVMEQTRDDLVTALDADAEDGAMSVGLMIFDQSAAKGELAASRWDGYLAKMEEAKKHLTFHLLEDPDDPMVIQSLLAVEIDMAFEQIRRNTTAGVARREAVAASARSFIPKVEEMFESLLQTSDPLDLAIISRVSRIEQGVDPDARNRRTVALVEKMLEGDPEDSSALAFLANTLKTRGDLVEAAVAYERLTEQPHMSVGLPGMIRMHHQTQAYRMLAEIALQQAGEIRSDDEAAAAQYVAQAKVNRDEYAERVGLSDPQLLYIDALIADANGDIRGSLVLFQRYIQSLPTDQATARVQGLWMQGQAAARLNEHGRARESFKELLNLRPEAPFAIIALAQSEMALANPQEALAQFRLANSLMPGNEAVVEQIRKLEIGLGLVASDDPIEQALAESRAALGGSATQASNSILAKQILQDAIATHGYAPDLARELATIFMMERNLDAAKEALGKSLESNPDDETLVRLNDAIQQDNMLDANLALIDSSPVSDTRKAVNTFRVLMSYDEPERAREVLAQARAANPDDTVLIDMAFVDALQQEDLAKARAVYEEADGRGVLGGDSLIYRARLEAVEGRAQEAIDTLTQAIELGATQSPVYRLLGTQMQAAGLSQQALEAYQTAYNIKPDDINNAKALMQSLYTLRRPEEALVVAREAQRFGRNDSGFRNMWLSLESEAGGEAGMSRAITVREQISVVDPEDKTNKIQLAMLYIDIASSKDLVVADEARREYWAKAKSLIDSMKAEEKDIRMVQLEARWLADQGRVPQEDGTTIDGIDAARGVFVEYILEKGDDVTAVPFVALAEFMMERGRYSVAESSLIGAKEYQTEDLEVDKILGSLYMDQKQFRIAAETFGAVVNAGKDIEGEPYRLRWIEMLLRIGEYAKAQEQLDLLPASMAEDLTTLLQQAEAADGLGQATKAAQMYDRAVALFPESPLPYSRRAEYRLRDANMLQDVLADLGQALSIDPTNVQTLQIRAGVFSRENRYEEMLADLTTALRANPQNTDILMSVMLEHLMRDEDGRAMDLVEETMRKRPRDLMLIATAAKVFEDRLFWDRAATLYQRGWELSGDHGFGLAYINSLISRDQPKTRDADLVLRQVRQLTGAAETDWRVDFAAAAIQFKQGNVAAAETALSALFETLSERPGVLSIWLGNLTALYGEDVQGRTAFLQKLAASLSDDAPGKPWARLFYAQSLSADEATHDEASSLFREMQALGETSPFARFAFRQEGAMYYSAGLYEEAVRVWEAGLDMFPGDWEMCNNAAFALATELNRPSDALPFALSAVEAAPQQSEAYDSLARVYIGTGELNKAMEALRQARRFSNSKRSDVSIAVTGGELNIERGELSQARKNLERLLLGISLVPDLREDFESDIELLLRRIDSLGG